MLKIRLFISFLLSYLSFASITVTVANPQIKTNITHRIESKVRNPPDTLNEQTIDQLYNEATEAIKPFGFFNPVISIQPNLDNPKETLIHVKLGPTTRFNNINITYINHIEDAALEAQIQKTATSYDYAPFTLENLSSLITDVKITALSAGYNDVLVTRGDTTVNRYTNQANITILIATNDINRYGQVILPEGDNPACFNRYHDIIEGEKYNEEKVNTFQQNMMRSRQFKMINILPQPRKLMPSIQDIVVEYERIKPFRYFLGFGIAANLSDKKMVPEVKADITQNNLGGCGIEFSNMFRYSQEAFIFESQLLMPSESNQDSFNALSFQFNNNNIQSEDSSNFWSLQWMFQYAYQPWVQQLSAHLLFEESTLNNALPYTTTLVYPQYNLSGKYDHEDLHLSFKTKVLGGLKSIGSDINFLKLQGSSYLKFNNTHSLIKNQVSVGKVWTDSFNLFPLSMQFYLGGADSHRGLTHHEINEGKEFFLSKSSAQIKINNHFLVGGFYDTGYCTNTEDYTLKPAVGALLSYAPSFGNFELSIGKLTNNGKWVILFNIEPGEYLQ